MRFGLSIAAAVLLASGATAQAFDPAKGIDDHGLPLVPPGDLLAPFVAPPYDNPVLPWIVGPKEDRHEDSEEEEHEHEFGPPPFGDPDIFGEPMPDAARNTRPSGTGLTWQFMGPYPIIDEYWSGRAAASGRVIGIAPHPTLSNVCYLAAASGGLWSTLDGGATWESLSTSMNTFNCGAIALDPTDPNILYLGTGEYTTGSPGDGLYKCNIAAGTWTRIALPVVVGNQISGIAIDPQDPNVIHVTGSRGYVRSTNGGVTFTLVVSGSCSSLALNKSNPGVVYIARAGDGIYRSPNKGQNFSKRASGIDAADIHRIVLAISDSNPSTLYAAIVNSVNGLQGFYATSTEGDTWTKRSSTPDFPSPQGWYDLFVGVDPTNSNKVYCGGVDPIYAPGGVIRSTDGGLSWTEIAESSDGSRLHPDHHAIAFGPGPTIWVGNDGGIQKSNNAGDSWINCNHNLAVTQIVQLAYNAFSPDTLIAGTQDNGTIGRFSVDNRWTQPFAGDGGFLAFDSDESSVFYATYVYLETFRYVNGSEATITGPWQGDARRFYSPLVMDPSHPKTLCAGTNRVWRTTDAMAADVTWSPLSADLFGGTGTLNAIAIAKSDSNVIYAGGTNGRIFVTTDLNTWAERSTGVPPNTVMDIIIDPTNAAVAYAAFAATANVPRVMRTIDYGAHWTDMTGDLPVGAAARSLAVYFKVNPPKIIMGAGAGYYISDNDGANWVHNDTEFPNVQLADLRIDEYDDWLIAGTYGRGAWRAKLVCIADIDKNGEVDLNDFFDFFNYWDATDIAVDFTGDGVVDLEDFFRFLSAFDASC